MQQVLFSFSFFDNWVYLETLDVYDRVGYGVKEMLVFIHTRTYHPEPTRKMEHCSVQRFIFNVSSRDSYYFETLAAHGVAMMTWWDIKQLKEMWWNSDIFKNIFCCQIMIV